MHTERLKSFTADLFNNVKYSDVVILLQGRKMPCHKIILAAQSDEWKNLSQLKVLDLTDIKFQVAYTMIRWIYTDEIKVKMDVNFFLDLLKVAVRFKLEYLHKRCRDALVTSIKADNVRKIQKISKEIDDQTLTDICQKFNADILFQNSDISSCDMTEKTDKPDEVKLCKTHSKTDTNDAAHIITLTGTRKSKRSTHLPQNDSITVDSSEESKPTTDEIKEKLKQKSVHDAVWKRQETNETLENDVADIMDTVHGTSEEIEDFLITSNEDLQSEDADDSYQDNIHVEMKSKAAKDQTADEEKKSLLKIVLTTTDNAFKKKAKNVIVEKAAISLEKKRNDVTSKKTFDLLQKKLLKDERRKLRRRQEVLLKNLEKGITNSRKPYKCSFCEDCFRFDRTRKEHENIHTGERPNICEHCGKSFRDKSSLIRHLRIHIPEKMYSCHLCDKKYTTLKFLNKHVKYHIGERKHKCTVCEKCFLFACDLRNHMKVHCEEKNWSCHICGKTYRTYSGLNYHIQCHENIRSFQCDQCDKSFLTKHILSKHIRSHSDERPYICDKCGRSFKYNTNLLEHCRIHTEGRPYKCEVCNKGFRVEKYLKRHYEFACGKMRSRNFNKKSDVVKKESESYEIHLTDNDTIIDEFDPGTAVIRVLGDKLADRGVYMQQTFSTNPL
ncbi:zinc finger protein 454-like isoform X2 [Patella vulgata]|nr:zinc finger protein 454-like isoform X2 [Patella vulgata]